MIPLIISAILILIFTSPFTVPLVEHMLNGEYAIFDTKLPVLYWTLDLKQFFVQISDITKNGNYLYINFNIVVILLSLVALFKLFTKKVATYRKKFIVGFLLIVIVSMTLVSNDTIWYYTPDFLNNIQFPWRACTFAVFGISLFAVEGLDVFYNLFKKKFEIEPPPSPIAFEIDGSSALPSAVLMPNQFSSNALNGFARHIDTIRVIRVPKSSSKLFKKPRAKPKNATTMTSAITTISSHGI